MLQFSALHGFKYDLRNLSEEPKLFISQHAPDLPLKTEFNPKDFTVLGVNKFDIFAGSAGISRVGSLNEHLSTVPQFIETSSAHEILDFTKPFVDTYNNKITLSVFHTAQKLMQPFGEIGSISLFEKSIINHADVSKEANLELIIAYKGKENLPKHFIANLKLNCTCGFLPMPPYVGKFLECRDRFSNIQHSSLIQAISENEMYEIIVQNAFIEMSRKIFNQMIIKTSPQQFNIVVNEDSSYDVVMPLFGISAKNARLYGAYVSEGSERWKELFLFKSQNDQWIGLKFENSKKQNETTRFKSVVSENILEVVDLFGLSSDELPFFVSNLNKLKPSDMKTQL